MQGLPTLQQWHDCSVIGHFISKLGLFPDILCYCCYDILTAVPAPRLLRVICQNLESPSRTQPCSDATMIQILCTVQCVCFHYYVIITNYYLIITNGTIITIIIHFSSQNLQVLSRAYSSLWSACARRGSARAKKASTNAWLPGRQTPQRQHSKAALPHSASKYNGGSPASQGPLASWSCKVLKCMKTRRIFWKTLSHVSCVAAAEAPPPSPPPVHSRSLAPPDPPAQWKKQEMKFSMELARTCFQSKQRSSLRSIFWPFIDLWVKIEHWNKSVCSDSSPVKAAD